MNNTPNLNEEALEREEAKFGDQRDVIQDVPGMDGNTRVLPSQEQLPQGMENAIRSEDGEAVEVDGEDEETGEDEEYTGDAA